MVLESSQIEWLIRVASHNIIARDKEKAYQEAKKESSQ
jgi:hypothetical protein